MRQLTYFPMTALVAAVLQGPTPPAGESSLRAYAEDLRIAIDPAAPGQPRNGISDLLTSEAGLIFTAHSGDATVRVFNPQGTLMRSFGKKGQGPGEFNGWLQLAAATRDTIVVVDGDHNLISSFRTDGTLGSMVQIEGRWADRTVVTPLLPDRALMRVGTLTGGLAESLRYVITDAKGRLIKEIAVDADSGQWGVRFQDNGLTGLRQPFLHVRVSATDHSGARGVLALPHDQWNGKPGQLKLLFINHDGIESERVLSLEARTVTKEDVGAWVKTTVDQLKNQASRRPGTVSAEALEQQVRAGLVAGDYWPVADALAAGRDGSIWVRPGWSQTDWTVFPPTGEKTFTVRLPAGVRQVFDVSIDGFWTVTQDSERRSVATRYRFR